MWNALDRTRRHTLVYSLGLLLLIGLLTSCLTPAREVELGDSEAKKVEQSMGLLRDAELLAYVQAIGQRLVAFSDSPDAGWSFQIVATQEPNAFALPGGHVYVSRGLLALINSEDELAGVIGHEIGHVTARHTVKRIRASVVTAPIAIVSGIAGAAVAIVSPTLGGVVAGVGQVLSTGLVVAPFSRRQENDADKIGQTLAARAGYDPLALGSFLNTLDRDEKLQFSVARKQSIMDYHPMTPERVANLSQRAATLERGEANPVAADRAGFLAFLEGIVVGEDPVNGIFRDNVFVHPVFDLSIHFPIGWRTRNAAEAAGAVSPSQDAVVALSVVSDQSTLAELLTEIEEAEPNLAIERLEINGLAAARGRVVRRNVVELVTLVEHEGHVFSIVGRAERGLAKNYARIFNVVSESFQPLSESDDAPVEESRLRLRTPLEGETLETLAARIHSSWSGDQIAVANALEFGEPLEAGRSLKVGLPQPFQAVLR